MSPITAHKGNEFQDGLDTLEAHFVFSIGPIKFNLAHSIYLGVFAAFLSHLELSCTLVRARVQNSVNPWK